jgi:hypothetical protein
MWIPDLPTDGTPMFQQILAALERSISDGELEPGARLPLYAGERAPSALPRSQVDASP